MRILFVFPNIDSPGYNLPESSLGEPARFTGENIWPGVVSPFNPPWLANEIVSIGSGGTLTVKFDEPIQNDSQNPYGIDFIIFGFRKKAIDLRFGKAIFIL